MVRKYAFPELEKPAMSLVESVCFSAVGRRFVYEPRLRGARKHSGAGRFTLGDKNERD